MCNKCKGETSQRKIVLADVGTTTQLTIDNDTSLNMEHKLIDGCVIKDGERCDHYLKLIKGNAISHLFVELKGSDVEKAACQIVSTIKSGVISISKKDRLHAAIVSTRNPLNSSETSKIKKAFLKKEQTTLHFYKMKAIEKIEKFV